MFQFLCCLLLLSRPYEASLQHCHIPVTVSSMGICKMVGYFYLFDNTNVFFSCRGVRWKFFCSSAKQCDNRSPKIRCPCLVKGASGQKCWKFPRMSLSSKHRGLSCVSKIEGFVKNAVRMCSQRTLSAAFTLLSFSAGFSLCGPLKGGCVGECPGAGSH